jgi:signal transduction histidine kinase
MPTSAIPANKKINTDKLFQRLPILALSGQKSSVEQIAYEVLNLLLEGLDADIGQINLLPRGGRVEKVCIVKDGKPWLKKDMNLHLFDPTKGFNGIVMSTGKVVLVEDIWASDGNKEGNPFLELYSSMNDLYVAEIKKPVASTLFLPIKRGDDVFCTIELSRYRGRAPLGLAEKIPADEFAKQYGTLIMNYILDVKNRIAIHTAHDKLNILSRLIATNGDVDYTDAVVAYRTLSAAELGFAFFRKGSGYSASSLRLVAWHNDAVMEVDFPEFTPSADSILCDNSEVSYPIEGEANGRRLLRFRQRISEFPTLKRKEQQFLLNCIDSISSYVIYPLHMLNQDLGAIYLASSRPRFWEFLHMTPFLSLYNGLLKSFLLNERIAMYLSEMSRKIQNPGLNCQAALKGALAEGHPKALADMKVANALSGIDKLLAELHHQGDILKCIPKSIHFIPWLKAFMNQKSAQYPGVKINILVKKELPTDCIVAANYEQLETVFENLFLNSFQAINEQRRTNPDFAGNIDITLWKKKESMALIFADNGLSYKTNSGRGLAQSKKILQRLGGNIRCYKRPFQVYLVFPLSHGS